MPDLMRDRIIAMAIDLLNEENIIELVSKYESPLSIISLAYLYSVYDKELTKLEDLTPGHKQELWQQAKTWNPDADIQTLWNICKAIHLKSSL